jgi:hypothetical protein
MSNEIESGTKPRRSRETAQVTVPTSKDFTILYIISVLPT